MRTNFFEQIAGMHKGTILLNIHTDDKGVQTVSAVVRQANDKNDLPPMLLTGTAQELDEGFFEAISTPVKRIQGLLTNLENYQKEVDKAGKQAKDKNKPSKSAAATAGDEGNENDGTDNLFTTQADDKEAKAEKKRIFEEQLAKVKNLAQQMKYVEAIAQLPDVAEYPEKAELLAAKKQELEKGKTLYDQLQNQFND